MTTTHTAGPWSVTMYADPYKEYWIKAGEAKRVAVVPYGDPADATLIAAAPDLLAALEILLVQKPYRDGDGAAMYHAENIARAAIAKAKGEQA